MRTFKKMFHKKHDDFKGQNKEANSDKALRIKQFVLLVLRFVFICLSAAGAGILTSSQNIEIGVPFLACGFPLYTLSVYLG